MKTKLTIALMAAMLSLSAGAQAAQATSSVAYSNLQFRVIDLTPADGAAAGFSLTGGGSNVAFYVNDQVGGTLINTSTRFPTWAVPPTSMTVSGKTMAGQSDLTSGVATALVESPATPRGTAVFTLNSTFTFDLAPNTALLVSGHVDATLSRVIDDDSLLGGRAHFYAGGEVGNVSTSFRYDHDTYRDSPGTYSDDFTFSFLNGSATTVAGGVRLTAMVQTFTNVNVALPPAQVSAVPEPGTWAMLGAGLLAVGAAVRRRKA